MMTGALSAFAVSRTLLIVFDPITLTEFLSLNACFLARDEEF